MFFLLRMAFWLSVVCVLLPSGTQSNAPNTQIDATQAVTVAGAAMSDMRGFCDRQPDACEVGGKVAVALGHKAEAGARTLYEFIANKLSEPSATAPAEKYAAKLVPAATTRPATANGAPNGTLTATDMAPIWRAPVPLPPRREARANRPSA